MEPPLASPGKWAAPGRHHWCLPKPLAFVPGTELDHISQACCRRQDQGLNSTKETHQKRWVPLAGQDPRTQAQPSTHFFFICQLVAWHSEEDTKAQGGDTALRQKGHRALNNSCYHPPIQVGLWCELKNETSPVKSPGVWIFVTAHTLTDALFHKAPVVIYSSLYHPGLPGCISIFHTHTQKACFPTGSISSRKATVLYSFLNPSHPEHRVYVFIKCTMRKWIAEWKSPTEFNNSIFRVSTIP